MRNPKNFVRIGNRRPARFRMGSASPRARSRPGLLSPPLLLRPSVRPQTRAMAPLRAVSRPMSARAATSSKYKPLPRTSSVQIPAGTPPPCPRGCRSLVIGITRGLAHGLLFECKGVLCDVLRLKVLVAVQRVVGARELGHDDGSWVDLMSGGRENGGKGMSYGVQVLVC